MVQQARQKKPLDSCVIAIESVTRNLDEERMTFGSSVEKVKRPAEQFLVKDYR